MTKMKTLALVVLFAVPFMAGCHNLRDMGVYQTEISFVDMAVQQSAPSVRRFLAADCACEGGVWSSKDEASVATSECASAADWYVTYSARWSWHVAMMRYNGGVTKTDPGAVPEIHASCDLPGAVVSGGAP
jgi:hypothetical protein